MGANNNCDDFTTRVLNEGKTIDDYGYVRNPGPEAGPAIIGSPWVQNPAYMPGDMSNSIGFLSQQISPYVSKDAMRDKNQNRVNGPNSIIEYIIKNLTMEEMLILERTTFLSHKIDIMKYIEILIKLVDSGIFDSEPFQMPTDPYVVNPFVFGPPVVTNTNSMTEKLKKNDSPTEPQTQKTVSKNKIK